MFLKYKKDPQYVSIVVKMLDNLQKSKVSSKKEYSILKQFKQYLIFKVNFQKQSNWLFPDNLDDLSDEQGAHFHQDIKLMEKTARAAGTPVWWGTTTGHFMKILIMQHTGEKAKSQALRKKRKRK